MVVRRIFHHPAFPYFFCASLPAVVFLLAHSLIFQKNSLDPYVYTSYIQDYSDLLARYGRTYYSTRIAHIFPAKFFHLFLGSDPGYLAYRYLQLLASSVATWGICRTFYSKSVAALCCVAMAFHPWFLVNVLTDHYAGSATVYLLVALYFLIAKPCRNALDYALAGAFFALAINCNFFLSFVCGAYFPALAVLVRERRKLIWGYFQILAGFLLCYGVLLETLRRGTPQSSTFASSTMEMTSWLLGGGGQNWFLSLRDIFFVHGDISFPAQWDPKLGIHVT